MRAEPGHQYRRCELLCEVGNDGAVSGGQGVEFVETGGRGGNSVRDLLALSWKLFFVSLSTCENSIGSQD